ncbi:MAG: serine/threonine-protein phosphatase [Clostridiales bacterium]|nr:serine/threonine-protein phosphatase [Clostridiales bacterium]
MKIVTSALCKQGGREYNQDYLDLFVDEAGACLVVCDGLGSYYGSEVASRICATQIIEAYKKIREVDPERAVKPEFCQSFIQAAHNCVIDEKERNPKIRSSCTTVACVTTDYNNTVISHIGDTRVYLFKNNKLHFQTKDHSLSQISVEMGRIPLRDIRSDKDQNKLTRVLGSDYYIPPDCDIYSSPLAVHDAFILCTDGFWEYVYEEEMEEDLASSATPDEALAKMERRLLSRVTKFNDNYTAIIAMVIED